MKYLCLVYLETEKLRTVPDTECIASVQGMLECGALVAAEALQPVDTATTVRIRDGRVTMTDGPFAETKEQLLGFYILDCENLDEVLAIARELGEANPGGAYEIRPVGYFVPGGAAR